eukprot:12925614-Alexandrium_andersonii.AAC.1
MAARGFPPPSGGVPPFVGRAALRCGCACGGPQLHLLLRSVRTCARSVARWRLPPQPLGRCVAAHRSSW